jgi:hypothetical protein
MKYRLIALAALATASLSAQATLVTLPFGSGWPPAGSSGLQNVLFNVDSAGGVSVALGAHAYKTSSYLANDGQSVFYADSGVYLPDGKNYANWSFDFVYDLGTCTTCHVFLGIDTDPTDNVGPVFTDITSAGMAYAESWNMEMPFLGLNFNPFAASSTGFELYVVNGTDPAGTRLADTGITVNVPEPGTFALAGLALFGMGALRRRQA